MPLGMFRRVWREKTDIDRAEFFWIGIVSHISIVADGIVKHDFIGCWRGLLCGDIAEMRGKSENNRADHERKVPRLRR